MDVKKKILLVEDDVALSGVYKTRLQMEGFETHEVNNGEDALSAAVDFKPDLILLDAMMPKPFALIVIVLKSKDLVASQRPEKLSLNYHVVIGIKLAKESFNTTLINGHHLKAKLPLVLALMTSILPLVKFKNQA